MKALGTQNGVSLLRFIEESFALVCVETRRLLRFLRMNRWLTLRERDGRKEHQAASEDN
jgi:hypothetical protein